MSEALDLAQRFRDLDPYDHPLGIHNVNQPNDEYIDAPQVDMTSIQTGSPRDGGGLEAASGQNRLAREWIERCQTRGKRVLVVNFDEGRPELDRRAWWSAYLGGGVWEAHVTQPYDRPMSAWEPLWTELGGTRAFMQSLPFHQMQPHNELVVSGQAFCLAKPGRVYALYLPLGGSVAVELEAGEYQLQWWNPANGYQDDFQKSQSLPGGRQELQPPGSGDWAAKITKRSP